MSSSLTLLVQKTEEKIVVIEKIAALLLFGAMALGVLIKILLRNFSQSDWAIETIDDISLALPHGVMALGFLGASLGISRFETIHIDLFNRFYSPRVKALIGRLLYLVVVFLGLLFIWLAWQSAELLEPHWIFSAYIPGLALITLKGLFRLALGGGELQKNFHS